jgi:hypothetical protein
VEAEKSKDGPVFVLDGDAYYSKNNFDRDRDELSGEKREGYYLASMQANLSLKHYLNESMFVAPYLNVIVTHDFGGKSWNRSYWNNNQVFGLGASLGKEHDFLDENGEYMGGWYALFFSEYQVITSSIDASKNDIPESVSSGNFKTGASIWYDRKKTIGNGIRLWTEFWGEMAYHSTYFNDKGEDNYLLATIAPRVGLSFDAGKIAVEPYVKAELLNDFLGEEWNREPWINYLQYGPGIRISLDRILTGNVSLFAEYLHVEYLDRKQEDVSDDIRAGLIFWIPVL